MINVTLSMVYNLRFLIAEMNMRTDATSWSSHGAHQDKACTSEGLLSPGGHSGSPQPWFSLLLLFSCSHVPHVTKKRPIKRNTKGCKHIYSFFFSLQHYFFNFLFCIEVEPRLTGKDPDAWKD